MIEIQILITGLAVFGGMFTLLFIIGAIILGKQLDKKEAESV